ncbi:MAG: hypothetical protein HKM24_06800 [Gammaproteobacteria bacterium]|nr:hypothetical protein [Gammaproteobacteria bacterium]
MKTKPQDLETMLTHAASKIVTPKEAKYYAIEVVEAHIRKSPRTNPLNGAVGDLEKAVEKRADKISYTIDLPAYFSIDFKEHGPLVYLKRIHDELEKRSSANGIAMGAFTNGRSMHTLHTWIQGLAKRGLLAIAVSNGGPGAVVPFNGTRGLFGTNPLAYGFQGAKGEIHCVDMATSEIPFFEIIAAHAKKEPLQERSAVNSEGEFTTQVEDALDFSTSETDPQSNIVPMGGGYKGYYIVYLMELLTSALIGMPSSPEMSDDFIHPEHGSILLVFNPRAMGTESSFATSVAAIHQALVSQKPKAGGEIRLPGQYNNAQFLARKLETIEVDDKLLARIRAISDRDSLSSVA